MRIEIANNLPPTRIQRRHRRRRHHARIDGHRSYGEAVLYDVVAVPVYDVRVEAHVHQVPDRLLVDAYLEGWVVGEYVAVNQLSVSNLAIEGMNTCARLKEGSAYREEIGCHFRGDGVQG